MKIIMTVLLLIQCTMLSYGQEATSLKIFDTRGIVDQPSFLKRSIRADFKWRTTVGVPGTGMFFTNITIAPWIDASGNLNHQLNFNNGGIYYRQGDFNQSSWQSWQKVMLTWSDGTLQNDIRIGRIGESGNKDIPIGAIAIQYNIDFTGYRDVQPDQAGARIAGIRYNIHQANRAYIQNTALAFYTNGAGLNSGTTDLLERMRISPDGNVGIGVANPQNKLDVAGTIRATEVKVETGWADFVFDKDYKLPSLEEVESHINEHKRLPDIPSESQVKEEGVGLGEMQVKLLQKIEELTLYVIEQGKEIKYMKEENQEMKKQLNILRK